MSEGIDHPKHYTSHPSGIECIQITEHMGFNLGNAMKYIWRADLKPGESKEKDLQKAKWYIERELLRLSANTHAGYESYNKGEWTRSTECPIESWAIPAKGLWRVP